MNEELRKQLLGRLLRELDEPFRIDGNYESNWTAPWLRVDANHDIEVLNYLEWVSEGRRVRVNLWYDERRWDGRIVASVTDVPGNPEAINKAVALLKSLVGTVEEGGCANCSFSEIGGTD